MSNFKDWLNCTVKYYKYVSEDGTGTKTFTSNSPIQLKCYLVEKIQTILDFKGQEVVSRSQIFIPGNTELAEGLSPSDQYETDRDRQRVAKNFSFYYDENGNFDYVVVYL